MKEIFYTSYTGEESFCRCARYYYYDKILKIEPESERLGMKFGGAAHTGLNRLYETKSLDDCLNAARAAWNPYEGQDVDKAGNPGVRAMAKLEEILTAYYEQFYKDEEWEDQGGEKLDEILIPIEGITLQDMFMHVGYFEEYIGYRLKIDREGLSGGVPAIQEWKFLKPILGSDFVPEPNNQIAGYLFARNRKKAIVTVGKVQKSSVNGMIKGRLKTDEPHSIFTRDPIFYEDFVFEEFKRDVITYALLILTCQAINYWPKNAPGSCNAYGGCPFKQLCAVAPEQREVLIELQFRKKEPYKEEK